MIGLWPDHQGEVPIRERVSKIGLISITQFIEIEISSLFGWVRAILGVVSSEVSLVPP
jgi:hypothetical protein